MKFREPNDVLSRIKRGLVGYVSYLAACEMNEAFSEYVLYEPILRILTARGYQVECEAECPGLEQPAKGDRRRIDFVAEGKGLHFALEVKWAASRYLNVERDCEKLEAFQREYPRDYSFLCVFGRMRYLEHLRLKRGESSFTERGSATYADFRRTRYGCRIFELNEWLD